MSYSKNRLPSAGALLLLLSPFLFACGSDVPSGPCTASDECGDDGMCLDGMCVPRTDGGTFDSGADSGADTGTGGDDASLDAATDTGAVPADSATADGGGTDASAPDASTDGGTPPASHTVFVSSMRFESNLGGLAGADMQCQALASAAGLVGNYKAILSDSTTDARDRLILGGPIFDTRRRRVLASATDLWGGRLDSEIRTDETMNGTTRREVWTGTDVDGTKDGDPSQRWCGDWTGGTGFAEVGETRGRDARWISLYGDGSSDHSCGNDAYLYCISQP